MGKNTKQALFIDVRNFIAFVVPVARLPAACGVLDSGPRFLRDTVCLWAAPGTGIDAAIICAPLGSLELQDYTTLHIQWRCSVVYDLHRRLCLQLSDTY